MWDDLWQVYMGTRDTLEGQLELQCLFADQLPGNIW